MAGVHIYLDGISYSLNTGADSTMTGTIQNARNLQLGTRDGSGSGPAKLQMEDAFVSGRELTLSEVRTIHTNWMGANYGQVEE